MGLHSFVGVWDMHMHMDMAKVLFVSYFVVCVVCVCLFTHSWRSEHLDAEVKHPKVVWMRCLAGPPFSWGCVGT